MVIYPFLPQTISLGKFHLYTYGLLIGAALVVGSWLIERRALKTSVDLGSLWQVIIGGAVFALIGARLWHLGTDWPFYTNDIATNHWLDLINLRAGGLSILGAILGLIVGIWLATYWQKQTKRPPVSIGLGLDLVVFGLPLAQAIGRLGNFANQELYGRPLPTSQTLIEAKSLQIKLYVEPAFRPDVYKHHPYYHPLFLYEIAGLIVIAGLIYWLDRRQWHFFQPGKGRLFLVYLTSYSLLRFFLEFVRLDKAMLGLKPLSWLGVNQLVLLLAGVFCAGWLVVLWHQHSQAKR